MNQDRNSQISLKIPHSLISKVEECVEKFNFKGNSSFIRESIQVGIDFLNGKETFMKTPEDARKFLEKIEPQFNALKRNDAILTIYKDLTKEEQEAIYYQLDQQRRKTIVNELELKKRKEAAFRIGYEIEPKVGYIGKSGYNGFDDFFRPVRPSDNDWGLLTQDQKKTLLEELENKLYEIQLKHKDSEHQSLKQCIEEISQEIEKETKLENE